MKKGFKFLIVLLAVIPASLFISATVFPTATIDLPADEIKIINEVADEYGLIAKDERLLLFVIRRIEQGECAEFGVIHPDAIGKGFRVQAEWAAGTIKKRYDGDLKKFARRYCPHEPHHSRWYFNALFYMKKWRDASFTGESC